MGIILSFLFYFLPFVLISGKFLLPHLSNIFFFWLFLTFKNCYFSDWPLFLVVCLCFIGAILSLISLGMFVYFCNFLWLLVPFGFFQQSLVLCAYNYLFDLVSVSLEHFHNCLMTLGFLFRSKNETKRAQRALCALVELVHLWRATRQQTWFVWRHHPLPYLPLLKDLCLRTLPFVQRRILPGEHCTGEWHQLLTNQHRFSFLSLVLSRTPPSTPAHPRCAWCTWILSPPGSFSATIRWLGSDGDLALWSRMEIPGCQVHTQFSSQSLRCEPLAEAPHSQQAKWLCFFWCSLFQVTVDLCRICFCSSKLLAQSFVYCCHLSCSLCLLQFDCFFFLKLIYVIFFFLSLGRAKK